MKNSNNSKPKQTKDGKIFYALNVPMTAEEKDRILSVIDLSGISIGKFALSALLSECARWEKAYEEQKCFFLTQISSRPVVSDSELEQIAKENN